MAEETTTVRFNWANKKVEMEIPISQFHRLSQMGEKEAWRYLVAAIPMSEKDKALGAALTTQDVVTMGKGDELSALMSAAVAGTKNLFGVRPEGFIHGGATAEDAPIAAQGPRSTRQSMVDAFQAEMRNINDRLEAERLQRGFGVGALEAVAGAGTALGTVKGLQSLTTNPTLQRWLGVGTGREQLLSPYTFQRVNPGAKIPRRIQPHFQSGPMWSNVAKTAGAGTAGAFDYGYWSGEGGLPGEQDPRIWGRLGRGLQAAPYGALFGGALPTVGPAVTGISKLPARFQQMFTRKPQAQVNPAVARELGLDPSKWYEFEGDPRYPAVRIQGQIVNRSDLLNLRGADAGRLPEELPAQSLYAQPGDVDKAAEVLATTRLRDAAVPSVPSTVRREGMLPDEMLGDVGIFDPLTLRSAVAAGGESAASAEARARISQRGERAGQEAVSLTEPHIRDIRGETAEGLIDTQTLAAKEAYTAAKETGDFVPIRTGSLLGGTMEKSTHFDQAVKNARNERSSVISDDPLLNKVGHDYPETKEELLGGYRNISEGDVKRYEAAGWEIKVTTKKTQVKDPTTGKMGTEEVETYRAIDPDGPNLKARQINEISGALNDIAQGTADKTTYGTITNLKSEFDDAFIRGKGDLEEAGALYGERMRLEGATKAGADILTLRPDEIRKRIDFDENGKPRTTAQKAIIFEEAMDSVAVRMRELKGRADKELVDQMKVLLRDHPHAFKQWKYAVDNAEKFGLSVDLLDAAARPKEETPEGMGEKLGAVGRRMAEFFFSPPFAATRQLDRALTNAAKIRNQSVNDAVVDLLTQTGEQRKAAERLIMSKINQRLVSQQDLKILNEVIRIATGRALAPTAEGGQDIPIASDIVKYGGFGLLGTGKMLKGLIPGVQ